MPWRDGQFELNTERFGADLTYLLDMLFGKALDNRIYPLTEMDLLDCIFNCNADTDAFLSLDNDIRKEFLSVQMLLMNHLAEGVRPRDVSKLAQVVRSFGSGEEDPYEKEGFCPALGDLLDDLPDGAGSRDLFTALFSNMEGFEFRDDLEAFFDTASLCRGLTLLSQRTDFFDPDTGDINPDVLSPRMEHLVRQALKLAASCDQQQVTALHLLAEELMLQESYLNLILLQNENTPARSSVKIRIGNMLPMSNKYAAPLPENRSSFDERTAAILTRASENAAAAGLSRLDERNFLKELQEDCPAACTELFRFLKADRSAVLDLIARIAEPEVIEPILPTDICSVRDLTLSKKERVVRMQVIDPIVRVFFRKDHRVVLLHGEHGVGSSCMAEVLAQVLKSGRFPQLQQFHVIRFDPGSVEDKNYETAVESVLSFIEAEPDRIYVLESCGKYFRKYPDDIIRRLNRSESRLMLVLDEMEHNEIRTLCGEKLDECSQSVKITEPDDTKTREILAAALPDLEAEYGVHFAKGILTPLQRMASDYLISRRFPKKAITLLEQTSAEVAAKADMEQLTEAVVSKEDLAAIVAKMTGLPTETVLGTGTDKDYGYLLSQNLVGQDNAVSRVAARLDLIQKGMVDKNRPAAVFVFAGLSGTGKTELAKQIAKVYSNSRSLVSFAMENFQEAHSVSGLIGSPAGYIGYEEGGKLINELNRSPYSVVLLDEIEKAHPKVWDPFMNLFDEGTIEDRRGVTASGRKAFFVLTSNIGQYDIARMLNEGRPMNEIEEIVADKFVTEKNDRGELCFRPEFIGRIRPVGGIVVFNALSYEALYGITSLKVAGVAKEIARVYDGTGLVVDDDVLHMMTKRVYDKNEEAIRRGAGYFGGRELGGLISRYVQGKIADNLRHIQGLPLIRIVKNGEDTSFVPVYSEADAEKLLASKRRSMLARVSQRFDSIMATDSDSFAELSDDKLNRLDALLSEVAGII